MTTTIEVASELTPDLSRLWATAVDGLLAHRGGPQLLERELGQPNPTVLLTEMVKHRGVYLAYRDSTLVGFAAVQDDVIQALFVERSLRRQGVGRSLVDYLMTSAHPPHDAHVLPGDRAMKSLFESFGWKARLLTMRGE